MAALLACVARHRARLYRSQRAPLSTATRAAVALYGAPRHPLVPWHGLPIVSSLHDVFGKPSYSTTARAGRPGKKNPSSRPSRTPRDGRIGGAAADRRHPSESATAGDRIASTPSAYRRRISKHEWMQQLVDNGDYQTLLRAVYGCYAPLYVTHPLLIGKECSLLASAGGAAATGELKFQPAEYDDLETQLTELRAIIMFRESNQLELALAVMSHREWIATTVDKFTLGNGTQVELGHHFAPYCYQAMQTHLSLRNYAQVENIYNQAIQQGVVPTAKMTCTYLFSLTGEKQFTKALELYQQVRDEKRLYDEEFCQKMLHVAHKTHNSEVAMQIIDTMRKRGYKLGPMSYFCAIASFQKEYYISSQDNRPAGAIAPRRLYAENYQQCMERIAEQATDPDKYASIKAASAQVIELFDEMARTTSYPLQRKNLFTQVVTAAMLLHQYDKIASYRAQYHDALMEEMDPLVVRIATNALLVQHQPVAAWELVLLTYAKVFDDSTPPSREIHLAASTLGSVVEYLKANQQTALLKKLLALLNEQGRLESALSNYSRKCMMATLMSDPAAINDDDMWQLVAADYAQIFPVLTDSEWLMMFVASCAYTGRWSLVSKVIRSRDKTKMAQIVPRLASFGNDQVRTRKKPYPPYLELVAQLPDLVVESEEDPVSDADKITLACNAIRALDALQQQQQRQQRIGDGVGNGSEIENESHRDWKLDILRLHGQYLSGATTIDGIPTQVQEIVKQAQLE